MTTTGKVSLTVEFGASLVIRWEFSTEMRTSIEENAGVDGRLFCRVLFVVLIVL